MSEHTVKLYYDALRELASVKLERDALAAMLKELQAENVELRKCVELYARKDNWHFSVIDVRPSIWWLNLRGYTHAQECLEKVKGGDV